MYAYGENTAAVLRNFSDLTEEIRGRRPDWVVDSSKDPYRLIWLIKSQRFDITLLHLVRDPRAFVNSERRNRGAEGVGILRLALEKSGAWVVHNELIHRTKESLSRGNYLLIRYEDLAAAPVSTLGQIVAAIGCRFEKEVVADFRKGISHALGGNRMRHDSRPICLDEHWRASLPPGAQKLTQLITAATRQHLAYRAGVPPPPPGDGSTSWTCRTPG